MKAETKQIGVAEVVLVGPTGTIFSFTSKMDLTDKVNRAIKVAKKILPTNPGCVHFESGSEGMVYNCSNLLAKKKGNGFLCELHQSRVFPSYGLGAEELFKLNRKGSLESQIILKDSRDIKRDLASGVAVRPRYGRFMKVQTEDEILEEMLGSLSDEDWAREEAF